MKQFFKFTFASMLGFIIAGVLLIFIGTATFVGAVSGLAEDADGKNIKIEDGTTLHLKLNKQIVERSNGKDVDFDFGFMQGESKIGVNQIKLALRAAADDDKIKGIYLDVKAAMGGYAHLKEIRDEILTFRNSGKYVYAYSSIYSQGAYYLASAADKVFIYPKGGMEWKGLFSELTFFKDALDKVGVEMQVIRGSNNKFKSAVEPFLNSEMSDANREQITTYLTSIWNNLKTEVAASRKLTTEDLEEYAENYLIKNPQEAVNYGLVDKTMYRDEFLDMLMEKNGNSDELETIKLEKYFKSLNPRKEKKTDSDKPGFKLDKIAVIYANGEIGDGKGDANSIGYNIADAIKEAREDEKVKAVVLRVNSPGGSALMSDIIWRETQLLTEEKPMVVSMGNYAASGGYYISAGANKIFAEPTTITGSIGVFGMLPSFKELAEEKIGVNFEGVETNKYARMGLPTDKLTDEEYSIIQEGVDRIYGDFTNIVAQGRNMKQTYVDSIGQGRVWTGEDGLRLGLVDALGSLDNAIDEAADLAGLEDYRTIDLPKMKDPFEEFMSELGIETVSHKILEYQVGKKSAELIKTVQNLQDLEGDARIQMRLPYSIEIK